MGKGGTKFVGDAIGARSGRSRYTGSDRQKDMEKFLATGLHPETLRRLQASKEVVPDLPPPKITRTYIFMQFMINKKDIGKIIIELFDDIAAIQANHFRSRATAGDTTNTYAHTTIHKCLRGLALFGGKRPNSQETVHMKFEPSLRHVTSGVVSISVDGTEFCIGLAKALHLDETHQVIGRVVSGMDTVVDNISSLKTKADDSPSQPVVIYRCGLTDAEGLLESDVVGDTHVKESEVEILQRDVDEARLAVQEALESGLKRKALPVTIKKGGKRKALDAMLLGGSSGSDSE